MATPIVPLFPGMPGGMELGVILLIAILLFGANKIPKLARSTGEAMGEFKKGREEVEQELQDMRTSGTTTAETTAQTQEATADTAESETEEATESADE